MNSPSFFLLFFLMSSRGTVVTPSFVKVDGKWVSTSPSSSASSSSAATATQLSQIASELASLRRRPRDLFGGGGWRGVVSVSRSEAGAAWFVTTSQGTVVCKSATCREFMGTFVAGELARCMRVRAPACRVIMWSEDEFAALKSGCLRHIEAAAAREGTPVWTRE